MCGIAGWVGHSREDGVLRSMTAALRHRGPDGDGRAFLDLPDGAVAAFGHRRLSIIDLSGGTQPMASHDGRFTMTYNGEIYNYVELREQLTASGARFRTASDTEVILEAWRAWGPGALSKFRGMFAFAIHDAVNGSVSLARDPFGKKPLFLTERQAAGKPLLLFGSEIAALLSHPSVPPDIDVDAVYDYLCWRYVPAPSTLFRGIRKLLPGTVMHWKEGKAEEERYWAPPDSRPPSLRDPISADPVEAFLEAFDEAVRLRLRADVPLGAFLSGGLDSSSIVASMAHLGASEIRTFSVGFRGDPASELPAAAETARRLSTIHTPLELETDTLLDLLPDLSLHRGSPIAETADLPIHLMSVEAEKHVKVILSGEGADELFAGYPKHLVEARLGAHPLLMATAGKALLAAASLAPSRSRRLRVAGRAMTETSFEERMVRWFGALAPQERDRLWIGPASLGVVVREGAPGRLPFEAAPEVSPLSRVLHFDQTSWLPDNLLERMDTMSMAASIEARTPFLDVRLAEVAASLPQEWRIRGRVSKRIVREALGPRLPEAVVRRRKNGFRMPVTAWFQGPLRAPFQDLVLGRDSRSAAFLDLAGVQALADEHAAGSTNHEKTLWALYALEIFLRQFRADG